MTHPSRATRLAVDVGGTFTDIVLEHAGARHTTKVLTTPDAPERAIIDGTREILATVGATFGGIDVFIHGTTLATNAIIERKGAKVGLIATRGFRDVIEIADEGRYDQYDLTIEKPRPLVPRQLRFTVPERMDVAGQVRLALDEAAVRRVAEEIEAAGIEAVAVALIHSYANPDHERRVGDIIAETCPGIAVTLSSAVCPEMREYERTSTAIANAYVQPLMAGYLGRLQDRFRELGYTDPIHLITSGGNLASLETARRFPIRLVESGPAGGAILAARIAAERDERKLLSFDMGGTTAKICMIENFEPFKGRWFEVDRQSRFMKGSGLPVRIPVIEMVEIGAGGGSIARVDALKRITVGPDSAASVPGPACYGRGGSLATVTDADLELGRIDASRFAGGRIALDAGLASNALLATIGAPLDLDAKMAAHGVTEIIDENMANAARVHAVERGLIVADHTLVAFGGAAPLHACRIAEKLGIKRIIIPADAGVGSAIGFLAAPAAYELVRSRFMRLDHFDAGTASKLLGDMSREATALAASAAGGARLIETRTAYIRYTGQGHEIAIELPLRPFTAADVETIRTRFEDEYRRLFERIIPGAALEILSWAVVVSTEAARVATLADAARSQAPSAAGVAHIFDGRTETTAEVPVYDRMAMAVGSGVEGPCIVVEPGTSTVVAAGFTARIDSGSALVLERS